MDIIDILKPQRGYTQRATYRRYQDESPKYFTFKEINHPSARFGMIMNNLITDSSTLVITTPNDLNFEINGFIVLQNNSTWSITAIERVNDNSESLRVWATSPTETIILGLQNVENGRGLI